VSEELSVRIRFPGNKHDGDKLSVFAIPRAGELVVLEDGSILKVLDVSHAIGVEISLRVIRAGR
jgi:hypothetical protein